MKYPNTITLVDSPASQTDRKLTNINTSNKTFNIPGPPAPPPPVPTNYSTPKSQDALSPTSRVSFAFCGELMLTNGHIDEEVGIEMSLSSFSDVSMSAVHPNVGLGSLHSHPTSAYVDFRVQPIHRPDSSMHNIDPRSPVPLPLPLGATIAMDKFLKEEHIARRWHHEDSIADGVEGLSEFPSTTGHVDMESSYDDFLMNQQSSPVIFHSRAAYSNIRRRFNVFVRS
jgi:hypothetical protein